MAFSVLSQVFTVAVTVSDVIKVCQTIHSAKSQVQQALYNNLEEKCLKLSKQLRITQQIHMDLKKKINDKTDQRIFKKGLLDAIQNAQTVSDELMDIVSGYRSGKYQGKEGDLEQLILEKTQSLQEAKEIVTYALKCNNYSHQYSSDAAVNINSSSEDTVTGGCSKKTYDGSKGQETVVNEISESLEETNVIQCSPTSSPISHVSSLPPCLPDSSSSSEDTVTDGCSKEAYDESEGQQSSGNEIRKNLEETNEPPTISNIPDIIQPHDVTTFKNQIFILMDGGICAYNMAGKRIKRYQEDGFKPFAATFLGAFLFVTDKKSRCVIKFDESLNMKKRFGRDNMKEPAGITSCEKENCIFVLTGRKKESAEVAKFTSDGEYKRCYCSNRLEDPWYIKKSSSDEFFISDFTRMAVDVYSYDFSNRLYTVDTKMHCRGMDIDDVGNIYISRREPGYKAQYEDFGCYSRPTKGWVTIEESPKPWFWQNQNKSLDFVRGLHYYRCQDEKFLMVVDPGNKRLKVISL